MPPGLTSELALRPGNLSRMGLGIWREQLRQLMPDGSVMGASAELEQRTTRNGAAVAVVELRVHAISYAARDVNVYDFRRPDGGALPSVEPGTHIDLRLPNGLVRQYSLLEPGNAPTRYRVGVKRDASGRGGSRFIHDELRVGSPVTITGPRNNFPLALEAKHSVLLAGGIGVTPILCMARRLHAIGKSFELHYSCRSRTQAAFLADLEMLGHCHFHADDEARALFDIQAVVARANPHSHLYCCGPAPMLAAFEAATLGWPTTQIHSEYFAPRVVPARTEGFMVELASSGDVFSIPPGRTILSVLKEAGIEVSSSCEEGVCGSCETEIIAGLADHRDSILSARERAANKTMMICCSRSKTERLVLNL